MVWFNHRLQYTWTTLFFQLGFADCCTFSSSRTIHPSIDRQWPLSQPATGLTHNRLPTITSRGGVLISSAAAGQLNEMILSADNWINFTLSCQRRFAEIHKSESINKRVAIHETPFHLSPDDHLCISFSSFSDSQSVATVANYTQPGID